MYWFVAILMLLTLSMTTFAANEANDGNIKIEVATDKVSYSATGIAEISAIITNVSSDDINNIKVQAVFSDLAPVGKRTSETSKSIGSLKAGDSISFKYKATLNAKEHKLNILQKIVLWFVRFINSGYNANNSNINVDTECLTEIKFGKFIAKNIIQVEYDENSNEISDDYKEFDEIRQEILQEGKADEVISYLEDESEVGNIKSFTKYDNCIVYETQDGIRGIWEDKNAMFNNDHEDGYEFKGISSVVISNDTEYAYNHIVNQVSSLSVDDDLDEVVVIRPYSENGDYEEASLPYKDFVDAGTDIAMAIDRDGVVDGDNLTVLNGANATLSELKDLAKYRVILVDSHGILVDNEPYICLTQTYSDTDISASDLEYILIDQNNHIRVNSKFFENNYADDAFGNSIVFLGTCYSMAGGRFSDVLKNKGVDSIYGYTNLVTIDYCNKTLQKCIEGLISGLTSREAYNETRANCKPEDPFSDFVMDQTKDFSLYKSEDTVEKEAYLGNCSSDIMWELCDGKIVIYGSGDMPDYDTYNSDVPWAKYTNDITEVVIEDGITSIGKMAFALCTNLAKLTVSDSVKNIEDNAFALCINLVDVTLGNGVAVIGESAFYGCKKLSNIEIPSSVATIDKDAFRDCKSLSNVYYEGSAEDWKNINIVKSGNDYLTGAYITYNS